MFARVYVRIVHDIFREVSVIWLTDITERDARAIGDSRREATK